ncbi:type I-E CRISPR-associated protein Cas5/CasD [Pseudonocardia sp. HH130630-07]|uniref:type I-E CRISPR-associated protein Cas5/CasD n=1 Tax=Pseudonocardia sp. HH130630-07 TaxID=1690815 RepID=UPI000814D91C|nr:type I-E CRISPR-associated protein Cas5/CasD [Pseudonocardia sp. HH130630-07]ANY05851.1 type I-E CRISPR-associated protein Cas5/CasD [Pseudonocardia sp. HH130630-07]
MTVLLLRLAGPLQSWGTGSRFTRRATDRVPSKSGVVGLLAAAQGRRRTDPLEELLSLRMGVRIEQAGRVERDFQTAARPGERTPVSVSTRHYLADAVFLAAVEGDPILLDALHDALRRPHFPLFLGRRSCPPAGPIVQGMRDGTAVTALQAEPWRAAPWFQKAHPDPSVRLDLVADCDPTDPAAELVRNEPVEQGFDPRHRQWEWRPVKRHDPVTVTNPLVTQRTHDPMGVL